MEVHAPLDAEMDGCQSRSIFDRCQLAGIAVGEASVAILQQRSAVFAQTPADVHILSLNRDCFIAE